MEGILNCIGERHMSEDPLVEIHVPCYNEEANLQRLLESIANQTYTNWRLYLHENLSTDSTRAQAKTAEAQSAGKVIALCYPKHQTPFGQWHRVNKFPHKADFIWFRSANDFVAPGYLEAAVRLMQSSKNIAIAYSHGHTVYSDNLSVGYRSAAQMINTHGMSRLEAAEEVARKYTESFALWGLYRRDVFDALRVRSCYGADHVWVCEAALEGDIVPIPDASDYRIITRKAGPYENEALNNIHFFSDSYHELRLEQLPRDSIFMTPDLHLPMTSMIIGHMEMIAGKKISDEEKVQYVSRIYNALYERFERLLDFEQSKFMGELPAFFGKIEAAVADRFTRLSLICALDNAMCNILKVNPKFASQASILRGHLTNAIR
jgi:glycosyltransferase involved in cell wall biosynthesis